MKASCIAPSNIALLKYWGNRDDMLRLPLTNSISFTLDGAQTTTTIEFRDHLSSDEIELDGVRASGASAERIARHLDLIGACAPHSARPHARVVSRNNFPMGAGIASSASGFAALTCAAAWALGLDLSERELSRLARRGSGSAARSVPGGFIEWYTSDRDEDSFAATIAAAEYWQLRDLVAIVARGEKSVGSTEGHALAHTSPLNTARIAQVENDLPLMRRAILERDFGMLGELAERDTLMMHSVMMTSQPSLLYWTAETVAVMRAVRAWRHAGLDCYFSIDAGPNVHVLTTPDAVTETAAQLRAMHEIENVIECKVGGGARRTAEHLF